MSRFATSFVLAAAVIATSVSLAVAAARPSPSPEPSSPEVSWSAGLPWSVPWAWAPSLLPAPPKDPPPSAPLVPDPIDDGDSGDSGDSGHSGDSGDAGDPLAIALPPVEPLPPFVSASPIEGDPVEVSVPMDTRDCYGWPWDIEHIRLPGFTLIRLRMRGPHACKIVERSDSHVIAALGELPAGRYVVDLGVTRVGFVVLPANTDPGPLPDLIRLRVEIAREFPPGVCFGMPRPWSEVGMFPIDPRTRRQLVAAYPDVDEATILAAYRLSMMMVIEDLGDGRFAYTYTSGHCCSSVVMHGTATLGPDGTIEVDAPSADEATAQVMPC